MPSTLVCYLSCSNRRQVAAPFIFHVSITVFMSFTMQQHVFLTQINWVTSSCCMTQMDYREKSGGGNVPAKSAINRRAWKLERTRSLLDEHRRQCWLMSKAMVVDMCARLECSPIWRLHRFLHESGYSYSTSQRTANKAKVPPFRLTVVC